jgi:chitinase
MVNIMTMDYGSAGPPDKMGENAINAGNSLFRQLKTLYPTKTDAQLWSMIGLTPMIGQNDVRPEVFTLDDARAVLAFAQEKQIGMLSMWSVARDQSCPGGASYVSPVCSGITQTQWDFMNIFKPFTSQ